MSTVDKLLSWWCHNCWHIRLHWTITQATHPLSLRGTTGQVRGQSTILYPRVKCSLKQAAMVVGSWFTIMRLQHINPTVHAYDQDPKNVSKCLEYLRYASCDKMIKNSPCKVGLRTSIDQTNYQYWLGRHPKYIFLMIQYIFGHKTPIFQYNCRQNQTQTMFVISKENTRLIKYKYWCPVWHWGDDMIRNQLGSLL